MLHCSRDMPHQEDVAQMFLSGGAEEAPYAHTVPCHTGEGHGECIQRRVYRQQRRGHVFVCSLWGPSFHVR
ncbi:hypothetical protein P4O66_014334 [Electrophorus voltai]|uniref:Uncharacterized protein n=1 Tax=Electrophorus voltai TaxID=2609070 RepID=A0AAD8YZW7_9TELE|nr:hypothetical protein P4O66_014334 [Electrophorus voltai]